MGHCASASADQSRPQASRLRPQTAGGAGPHLSLLAACCLMSSNCRRTERTRSSKASRECRGPSPPPWSPPPFSACPGSCPCSCAGSCLGGGAGICRRGRSSAWDEAPRLWPSSRSCTFSCCKVRQSAASTQSAASASAFCCTL
eukprot:scaffold38870_cov51-Phaeocystis_antarctica.AAC.2